MPALTAEGKLLIANELVAAAVTTIPVSLPVMLDVDVSVAVIDCVPAVLSVTEKVCVPPLAAMKV